MKSPINRTAASEVDVTNEIPPETIKQEPRFLHEKQIPRVDDGGESTLSGVPRESGGHRDPKPASAKE